MDIKESIKSVALGFFKAQRFLSKFISKKQVVDTTLNITRSAGQKVEQKAIDFASSKLTPKSQQILLKLVSSPLATPQTTQATKRSTATANLNNLIAGSGQSVIKIQDLLRRLNKQKIVYNK